MTLSQITEFLGWASVLNISFLLIATVLLIVLKDTVLEIHSQLFNIDKNKLTEMYFQYLGNYKIASLVFCVVPYLSLKLMGE